jgi:PadR family transcriptional regulator PadR
MAEMLGAFEQAVLLAILRLGEDAYGRAILKEVQERLKRDVAAGAVHATLERLAKKGLVVSHLGAGTPMRGGRARRFYRVQTKGVRALNDARATADNLWHGLTRPLKGYL